MDSGELHLPDELSAIRNGLKFRAWTLRATAVVLASAPLAVHAQWAEYTNTGVHPPIALHQLVVVPPGGDAVLTLRGYDKDGDLLKATVQSLPAGTGTVYQLSKVRPFFVDYCMWQDTKITCKNLYRDHF